MISGVETEGFHYCRGAGVVSKGKPISVSTEFLPFYRPEVQGSPCYPMMMTIDACAYESPTPD